MYIQIIHIYIYRERDAYIDMDVDNYGWANHHFNNLHFKSLRETNDNT